MSLVEPLVDPLGKVLVEIRDYWIAAGLGNRVRGKVPAKDDIEYEIDPDTGARRFANRFCTLVRLSAPPHPSVPVQTVRIGFNAYGKDDADAALAYGAVVAAVHDKGPREHPTSGYHIYRSWVETGGSAANDPDTLQPYESGVIVLIATSQEVTV